MRSPAFAVEVFVAPQFKSDRHAENAAALLENVRSSGRGQYSRDVLEGI